MVCGREAMVHAFGLALLNIIQWEGGFSAFDAEEYIHKMKLQKRLLFDEWIST